MQVITAPGKKDRDYFILQAVFGTMVISLFLGVFLTGLYIYMGAPDSIMAYIPLIPNIAGLFLVLTGSMTESVKKTKRTVIILNIVSKTFMLLAVFVPLFVPKAVAPYFMLPMTFIGFTINAIMSILINSWFVDTVDISIRGRYMGARQVFTLFVSATLPVIAGNFLDGFYDRYIAFCIIYCTAWFFSLFESYSLSRITEPPIHEHKHKKMKFAKLFSIPVKNKPFMKFLWIQVFFHMAWFASMSFAQLYQIKYMELSYSFLTTTGSMNAIIQMFLYPVWGRVMDRYGSSIVMRAALFMFMIHSAIFFFMVKGNAPFLMVLLNINAAILMPAWILSTFNERFSTIPTEGRTAYDSFFTTVLALVAILAPTLGNLLRKTIISSNLRFWVFPEFKLLFSLTFVMLLTLNVILLFKSKKESNLKTEKELAQEIKVKFTRRKNKKAI